MLEVLFLGAREVEFHEREFSKKRKALLETWKVEGLQQSSRAMDRFKFESLFELRRIVGNGAQVSAAAIAVENGGGAGMSVDSEQAFILPVS
jgi:hypothetical protein